MIKLAAVFGAGFLAGGVYVLYQIVTEEFIVSHNMDGSVTISHKGEAKLHYEPPELRNKQKEGNA